MSNSKTKHLVDASKNVAGYRVTNDKGDKFDIPILDNRNPKHQERISKTTKEVNALRGSKFFKQSYSAWGYSYNWSMKK